MRFKAERRGRLLREENDEHVLDGNLMTRRGKRDEEREAKRAFTQFSKLHKGDQRLRKMYNTLLRVRNENIEQWL